MSLYRSKKSPFWQYDIQWQGTRIYGSTGCRTKADAKVVESRKRQELVLGLTAKKPPITVDDGAGLYASRIEEKPGYRTSRPILAAMVAGLGAARLLSEITQADLMKLVARRRDGRANSSVNREIEDWRACWRWAGRNKFDIGEMPDWSALMLPVDGRDPREATVDEEARLFAALREDLRPFVLFALRSGWRMAEVLKLCWADIDLEARQASTRIKGGRTIRRPLSREMLAIISSQPKVAPQVFTYVAQASRTTHTDKKGRLRVARRKGERYPLSVGGWRKEWKAALKRAKIANLRFHDLRHTLATRMLRATGNLHATKEALKHRSIKTTLRYAHVLDSDIRDAYEVTDARNSPGAKSMKVGNNEE